MKYLSDKELSKTHSSRTVCQYLSNDKQQVGKCGTENVLKFKRLSKSEIDRRYDTYCTCCIRNELDERYYAVSTYHVRISILRKHFQNILIAKSVIAASQNAYKQKG